MSAWRRRQATTSRCSRRPRIPWSSSNAVSEEARRVGAVGFQGMRDNTADSSYQIAFASWVWDLTADFLHSVSHAAFALFFRATYLALFQI